MPSQSTPSESLLFLFRDQELLVTGSGLPAGDSAAAGIAPADLHRVGELDGRPCLAGALPGTAETPAGMSFTGLRSAHGLLDAAAWRMAGRAFQILHWDLTHQFCGRCGARTELKADEAARQCPACGLLFFPRISPAVIVLIRDGERLLLARGRNFPPGRYSTIAGFVEAGETLEEAVAREVAEEVGVAVANIRYFGSQPWPFPHSLMIGFTADYAGGEISIQESEIADAGWFTRENLPDLPPPFSIARALIDRFLKAQQQG